MRHKIAFLLVVFVLLLSCNLMTPTTPTVLPTDTSTPTNTATVTATLTPTFTATSTATSTDTPTPTDTFTPAPTDTPQPTPTPKGYYRNSQAGFALSLPTNWEMTDENTYSGEFTDSRNDIVFYVSSWISGEELVFAELLDEITASFFEGWKIVSTSEESEVLLANGVKATQVTVEGKYETTTLLLTLTYAYHNSQSYIGMLYAEADALDAQARTIDRLYASLDLFRPQKFDLNANETLYLDSYDPDPSELDPALTGDSAQGHVGYLFSGLVRLTSQLQILPDLAESWTISADGTVYTFKLRPGIQFSSGEPITAQDFKDCWERAADPELESSSVRTYLGDIVGINAKMDGQTDEVSGIRVIDEQTLEVTLDGPKPYFLAKLTYPTSYVYKVEEAEAAPQTWVYEPSASGPYVVRDYIENEVFIFERNENYYAPPAIKYVALQVLPGVSGLSLFNDGLVDILYLGGEEAEQIRKPEDPLHSQWQSAATLCTSYIQLNNTLPPFDDPLVRQAFAQAIDRDALNERFANNTNIPALTILPPGMPGFSADLSIAPYDFQSAKDALAASSYAGDLPTVTLTLMGRAGNESDYINAILEMWKSNLGVQVKVEYVDPLKAPQSIREQHGQMASYGWCADYPDPENFLDVLFHTGNDHNVVEYTNPAVDALLEQARTELDPAKRLALYQQAEALLLEDFALIPLQHNVYDVLVNPRLKGFILSPMHASFIHEVSLESQP